MIHLQFSFTNMHDNNTIDPQKSKNYFMFEQLETQMSNSNENQFWISNKNSKFDLHERSRSTAEEIKFDTLS